MAEIEMPEQIRTLIKRCEINETSFSNDDMSDALKFAEMLWRRLSQMARHYESKSIVIAKEPHVRSTLDAMVQAAIDMKHVLRDCTNDNQEVLHG